MLLSFDYTGVNAEGAFGEYSMVEALDDTTAIYQIDSSEQYRVLRISEYLNDYNGVTYTYIYGSDIVGTVEEAKALASGELELLGTLESDVNMDDIVWNPRNVLVYALKNKTLTSDYMTFTFDENAVTTFNGDELSMWVSTSDKATMEESTIYEGFYYIQSDMRDYKMRIKLVIPDHKNAASTRGEAEVWIQGGPWGMQPAVLN